MAILILSTSIVMAGETNNNAGTSAFPFLKVNVGARAVAMGGAFTGLADDDRCSNYATSIVSGHRRELK